MLDDAALDTIFRTARTHFAWNGTAIPDEHLHRLYDLLKFGPTSANCSPARFVFLRSKEARERLLPALSEGNVAKTMAAAVTVIVAFDPNFSTGCHICFRTRMRAAGSPATRSCARRRRFAMARCKVGT